MRDTILDGDLTTIMNINNKILWWVSITKQACRDESIVSVFSPISIHSALYFYASSSVQQKNQTIDFLYIYICVCVYIYIYIYILYIYIYIYTHTCIILHEAHVSIESSWDRFLGSYNQPDNWLAKTFLLW